MTTKYVHSEVLRFIQSETPGVLAVSGEWGVGKTFAWNKWLSDAAELNTVKAAKYGYVSLFGVNSLDSLKLEVAQSLVSIERLKEKDTEPQLIVDKIDWLGRNYPSLIAAIPQASNAKDVIASLSFKGVSKALVCIDDLERMGTDLDIKDVLGLISNMRDQFGCKVLVILNEGLLKTPEEVELYSEKVFDNKVTFAPTAGDCLDLLIAKDDAGMDDFRHYLMKFQINNIRVIKKLEALVRRIEEELVKCSERLKTQISQSIVVLGGAKYSPASKSIPPYDFIIKDYSVTFGMLKEHQNDDKKKQWAATLRECDFSGLDDFDKIIQRLLETGILDVEGLKREAAKLEAKFKEDHAENSFSSAWKLYHGSLKENHKEVVEALYSSFKDNVQNISPINLDGTIRLLREVGEGKKAGELIEHLIEVRDEEPRFWNLKEYAFASDIQDPDLKRAYDEKFKSLFAAKQYTPLDALEKAAESRVLSKDWLEILSPLQKEDFVDLFRGLEGEHGRKVIRASLELVSEQENHQLVEVIKGNAIAALRDIAAGSLLNARRIEQSYGVKLEEPDEG